jgi:hypothetical protein
LTVFAQKCPICGKSPRDSSDIAADLREARHAGQCEMREPPAPRPYRQRLASYLRREEADVFRSEDWRTSAAPLQVSAPLGPFRGTRPPWLIRFVLKRIRKYARLQRDETR